MTYQTEFPDFDPATMPILLGDWADASWHNDATPTFIHQPSGICLSVDYIHPALREFPHSHRFVASRMAHDPENGWQHTDRDTILALGETWAEIEPALAKAMLIRSIAHKFATDLLDEIGSEDFAKVRQLNSTADYGAGICASHNVCDANMVMDPAFEAIMGRSIVPDEGEMSEADCAIWNAAWDIAKAERLTERAAA